MKKERIRAKVIGTGELVDLDKPDKSTCYYSSHKGEDGISPVHSLDVEVETEIETEIDWEQRRYEIAKTALNGMLAHSTRYKPRECDNMKHWHEAISIEAIEIADEMIKQLKGE